MTIRLEMSSDIRGAARSAASAVLDRGWGKPAPAMIDEDDALLDREVNIYIYSGKKEDYESRGDEGGIQEHGEL